MESDKVTGNVDAPSCVKCPLYFAWVVPAQEEDSEARDDLEVKLFFPHFAPESSPTPHYSSISKKLTQP
jgi:hypothetical protein